MEPNDQEQVTFYNEEEGWELQHPLASLLTNQVFAAMLNGQFKESNTKRINMQNYSQKTVERFLRDFKNNISQYGSKETDSETILVARLAHQYNEQSLVLLYINQLLVSLQLGNKSTTEPHLVYDVCKLVFDFSVERHYHQAFQYLTNALHVVFELDDYVLLKVICSNKRYDRPERWLDHVIQYKAYRCLKVILEEIEFQANSLNICTHDQSLPEDLIHILLEKYPETRNSFITNHNSNAIGIILSFHASEKNIWLQAFDNEFIWYY